MCAQSGPVIKRLFCQESLRQIKIAIILRLIIEENYSDTYFCKVAIIEKLNIE